MEIQSTNTVQAIYSNQLPSVGKENYVAKCIHTTALMIQNLERAEKLDPANKAGYEKIIKILESIEQLFLSRQAEGKDFLTNAQVATLFGDMDALAKIAGSYPSISDICHAVSDEIFIFIGNNPSIGNNSSGPTQMFLNEAERIALHNAIHE